MAKTPPFSLCKEFCVGGGGGASDAKVQSDYNQNDETAKDYIKNRPFYEDTEFLGEANYAGDGSTSALPVITSRALVEGEKIIVYREQAGKTIELVASSLSRDNTGDGYSMFDNGVFYSWDGNNKIEIQIESDSPAYAKVYSHIGIKQLDEKFIPDRIKYTYVTDKKLGEAVPMIDDTTTFIGLDEELNTGDMIMVKGYFNDGTSESYVVEVGEIGGDYGGRIDADVGRLDNVHVPISTAVTFQSEIKGEVYKLNKKPISEATTELYGIVKEIDEALDRVIEKYGLGGFVMPDGAFAIIEEGMSISAGTYEFVAFITTDGEIYETIPEGYTVNGAVGTDYDNISSTAIATGQNLIIKNDGIIIGFTYLSGLVDGQVDGIVGTTYIVRVGDA